LIERFQRHAVRFLNPVPQSKIEWLSLMQHYGLPTRLLDWTENPLIALFFALNENYNTVSNVWIIDPTYLSTIDINIDSIESLQLFFPKLVDNRIISQKGCFTIQPFPKNLENFISIEELVEKENIGINELTKIIIPNDNEIKKEMLFNLINLGIDNSFIYPDLTGLCKQIKFELENDRTRF
jgi:hypothetical protein